MPHPIGPKKKKKIRIKKEKKRAREAEARKQLVDKSTAEANQAKRESEILGRQRVRRPERNPKRPNRFSGSGEPPIPPPQLLDAIHEFLQDYRYIKAAHGMRTDNQRRPGHSQDVWKWTSKGLPFLSDIFIQWKEQNPETVQEAAVERKRALLERERWKAETNEAKRQKKELKRKRRDMAVEAARLEVEKDFDAVAIMREKMRKAEKQQQRLDGFDVSDSEAEKNESGGEEEETKPGIPEQTNKALESGSESDDESDASSDGTSSDSEDEEEASEASKNQKPAADAKPTVNGASKTTKAKKKEAPSSDSDSSSDSSDEEVKPAINGTGKAASKEAASSSSDDSSDSSSDEAQNAKPKANGIAKATAARTGSSSSSSASSSSSSDSEDEKKPAASAKATAISATSSKKRKAPASSSSSSASSSGSNSDSAGGAPPSKKKKTSAIEPESSQTVDGDAGILNGASKKAKDSVKPFSRIPEDVKVAKSLSSNAYVPYEYAQSAYDDLSAVKGKGFTKEKNKKKRGQGFRGGKIDIADNRAVKFED